MTPPSAATCPPPHMAPPEVREVRDAVDRAQRLYPGPVGEVLARELQTMIDLGRRFGAEAECRRLVRFLADEDARRAAVPEVSA